MPSCVLALRRSRLRVTVIAKQQWVRLVMVSIHLRFSIGKAGMQFARPWAQRCRPTGSWCWMNPVDPILTTPNRWCAARCDMSTHAVKAYEIHRVTDHYRGLS